MVLKFVCVTLGLSGFILLLLSPSLALSEISSSSGSTCRIDNECLDYLHNSLLNKESDESIYQFCEVSYQNSRDCCINPSQCGESYAEDLAQSLRSHSLSITRQAGSDLQSCQLNNLSNLIHSLSSVQSGVCHAGVENCKSSCEDKLEKFKQTFRDCFSIQYPHTIDSVLKKAQSLLESPDCYREIRDVAEKYKRQSLNKQSLFEEGIKAKDIVDCESIKKEASQANLNHLALNVCYQAQAQKQQEEQIKPEPEGIKDQTGQSHGTDDWKQQQEMMHQNQEVIFGYSNNRVQEPTSSLKQGSQKATQSQKQSLSEGQALVGLGAVAGLEALTGATNKESSPIPKQEISMPQSSFSDEISPEEQIRRDKLYAGLFPAGGQGQNTGVSKKQTEAPKGFFKKTVDRVKSAFKKSVDFVKDILPFMDSEKELTAKAEQLCQIKRRLLSLSQVVYQSVKAPQIERQDKEGRRPFDDYDLIRDKPAGVIVKIRKSRKVRKEGLRDTLLDFDTDKLIERFDFLLSLKVNGKPYNKTLCSLENLKKEDVEYKPDLSADPEEVTITAENAYCSFNWSDLKGGYIYKFISLPTKLGKPLGRELGPVKVEILSRLKPKNSLKNEFVEACESSEEFTVNMLEPKSFKVLFTGLTGPYCGKDEKGNPEQAYDTTREEDIKWYLNSTEIRKDFYDMFPVSKRSPNKPEIRLLQKNNLLFFPLGDCDKSLTGIYRDVFSLHHLNLKHKGDRIMAVFDSYYVDYHEEYVKKYGKFAGMAFPQAPSRYIPTPFGDIHIFHGIDTGVAIVQKGYEKQGVFLHELAHTLGQLKEHYPPKKHQTQHYCSQFTVRKKLPRKEKFFFSRDEITGIPCQNYRVTGGLVRERDIKPRLSQEPRRQIWKLLNNQESIMHSSRSIRNNGIYQKWIDRETHQKVLATLKNNLTIPEDFFKRIKMEDFKQRDKLIPIKQTYNNIMNCAFQKRPVITVSGIYDKEKKGKDRFKNFSAQVYEIKKPKNPFSFSKISMKQKEESDYIRVELKRNGHLDQAMIFSRTFHIEFFHKNGRVEQKEMDKVPVFASFFPVCESFDKNDYTVSVKELYMENGVKKEKVLINSALIEWEKDKGIEI